MCMLFWVIPFAAYLLFGVASTIFGDPLLPFFFVAGAVFG